MLLLPLSLGISSLSLLHILANHLQNQKRRTGRTSFSLVILHIDYSSGSRPDVQEKLELLRQRYPDHSYAQIAPEDVYIDEQAASSQILQNGHSKSHARQRFQDLFSNIISATSRADVLAILRVRVIVRFALDNRCEGIIWGDSTTKLAEKALAETAKGRGFGLPWQVTDGMSPWGVAMYYPLRDVLKKEALSYAELVEPPLNSLVLESDNQVTSPSARNATIDILMKQYFESVENNYPSIVSNVVRTTEKLLLPSSMGNVACRLCKIPVTGGDTGTSDVAAGSASEVKHERDSRSSLCYGCTRTLPVEVIALLPP